MARSEPSLVSVVVPVRNGGRYLAASIESVLHQTYPRIEVIVVDDGSSDESVAIADSFGEQIQLFRQKALGVWEARNNGIRHARGDYFALQDADDLSVPERVELQIDALESTPSAGLVFGHMFEFQGELGCDLGLLGKADIAKVTGHCPGTALIRRETFKRVGEFETNRKLTGFLEWFMKSRDLGVQNIITPEILLARRVHEKNSTLRNASTLHQELFDVIRARLGRR